MGTVNLLCQAHLINGINPLLNSKCFFSWVGPESSNVKAELEINHEEKLAQRIILYEETAILDPRKDMNRNKLIN